MDKEIHTEDGRGIRLTRSAARRARLLDLLPDHDWSIARAGKAAGYSEAYASTHLARILERDREFCNAVLDRRKALEATTGDLRAKVERRLTRIIDEGTNVEAARAAEVLGRMCGWMSEKRIIETDARLAELSEAEAEEARRLAGLRFATLDPALPPPEQPAVFEPAGDGLEPPNDPAAEPEPAGVKP